MLVDRRQLWMQAHWRWAHAKRRLNDNASTKGNEPLAQLTQKKRWTWPRSCPNCAEDNRAIVCQCHGATRRLRTGWTPRRALEGKGSSVGPGSGADSGRAEERRAGQEWGQ